MKACVIGAGSWGTAMAVHIASLGKNVTVWNKFEDEIERIKKAGENEKYLPGIKIPFLTRAEVYNFILDRIFLISSTFSSGTLPAQESWASIWCSMIHISIRKRMPQISAREYLICAYR